MVKFDYTISRLSDFNVADIVLSAHVLRIQDI